jgi:hypothetical protein
MNGPIAQIVALTCHANAFLRGERLPRFFPTNSTFHFCDRITFVEFVKPLFGSQQEKTVAESPDDWFALLRARDAHGVRLARSPHNDPRISDRMSAGFIGGGGSWSMEVLLPKQQSEFWAARWQVWNQNAPDRRIWRVTYGRISEANSRSPANQDIIAAESRFLTALREIHGFSAKHNCGVFTDCFAKGIASLTDSKHHGYHTDLAPDGLLRTRATNILDACQSAWVFGGMGSWNDMGFDGDDGKEYERVSAQLFDSLTEAICAATNSGMKE